MYPQKSCSVYHMVMDPLKLSHQKIIEINSSNRMNREVINHTDNVVDHTQSPQSISIITTSITIIGRVQRVQVTNYSYENAYTL